MKLGILFRNISDFCNSEIWQTLKPWVTFLVITILWTIFYALRSNRKRLKAMCKSGHHPWRGVGGFGCYCPVCKITVKDFLKEEERRLKIEEKYGKRFRNN